mgnify:CR=1 FL=1
MSLQNRIQSKLTTQFSPLHLEVVNESHMHNVPEGSESHFKVTIVADAFDGRRLIDRHRQINGLLAEELKAGVHALALHTMTPDEWFDKGGRSPVSPPCMGGDKETTA